MNNQDLPAPLVPAHVDLRDLLWMPLHVATLIDSDLFALTTGDEFKAAVALWCKSWHQQPAGSLPSDERVLAHLSSTGPAWPLLREAAMRGWVKCSDGRYYHKIISVSALKAQAEREKYQAERERKNQNLADWREKKRLKGELSKTGGTRKPNVPHGTETGVNPVSQVNETGLKPVSSGNETGFKADSKAKETGSEMASQGISGPLGNRKETSNKVKGKDKEAIGGSGDHAASDDFPADFLKAWMIYPKRMGDNPKRMAFQCWNARIKQGCTVAEMYTGLQRYVAFCTAKGDIGTSFVMQATRFFGPDTPFRNAWVYTPPAAKPGAPASNPDAERAWLELRECLGRGRAPTEGALAEAYRAIGGSRLMEITSFEVNERKTAFISAWTRESQKLPQRVADLAASLVRTQ